MQKTESVVHSEPTVAKFRNPVITCHSHIDAEIQ
jgi:hypothetical protein